MPTTAVVRQLKAARNFVTDRYFRSRRAPQLDGLLELLKRQRADNLAFTIAFNTPWVIDLMTLLWAKNVVDTQLVVADNSSSRAAADAIGKICSSRGVPYLKLPFNPEWNPNRSHGIAANWLYYNVVRTLLPVRFGFVDHDCLPIAHFSLERRLANKKVFGLFQQPPGKSQWNLWAGFTFMNTDFVRHRNVDFKPLHHMGMDTGGGNWPGVYSQVAMHEATFASYEKARPFQQDGELQVDLLDHAFLHIGGVSYAARTTDAEVVTRLQQWLREKYL